jgi:hypothetical protein
MSGDKRIEYQDVELPRNQGLGQRFFDWPRDDCPVFSLRPDDYLHAFVAAGVEIQSIANTRLADAIVRHNRDDPSFDFFVRIFAVPVPDPEQSVGIDAVESSARGERYGVGENQR